MTSSPADVPEESSEPSFLFVACNPRSQNLCKQEVANAWPDLSPSFSRPGFLTYKLTQPLPQRFDLSLTFARTFGWSFRAMEPHAGVDVVTSFAQLANANHVHVWSRDWIDHHQEQKPESETAVESLCEKLAASGTKLKINEVTAADEKIVDAIWIDPDRWWLGWHVAGSIPQRWPGGVPKLELPKQMVSRAWLKTSEAILWSGITIGKGDICAEIGSAPGGSCQRLLELGAEVMAIDPADLDESIANHPRVTHLKMRGRDVPHRSLSKVSWLLVDSNVAPKHTLDTVEGLTSGKQTHFRGLLLTLKFTQPGLAAELASYVERIKSWGFRFVKTRQLAYGRQEVCLMALKQKSVRRFRS